ncbi:rhodanese-like domain-containing protein [Luteipulveratus flavus]|uniref:Rhodanese-like domain-containing protein n=1 Tax=Luteipulveratus flavus TaxID=3031728 RepID=A0ABT6C999_9MICO|nr:rhodanese-like domain-containing protein [Luteipulveratus sp. YIM 133296]MDF8265470.1 rhodanese-like domain-containing protein [Luteipulveratus sp. YIM 133296]
MLITATTHARWETSLFSGVPSCPPLGAPGLTSPRAAYQAALWGRARLVDVRPHGARDSVVHPDLAPREESELDGCAGPVIVVGESEQQAAPVAGRLAGRGVGPVTVLAGGFARWAQEQLPTARA